MIFFLRPQKNIVCVQQSTENTRLVAPDDRRRPRVESVPAARETEKGSPSHASLAI